MRSLITTLKIELLGKGRNGDKGQAKRTKGGEKEEKREENERKKMKGERDQIGRGPGMGKKSVSDFGQSLRL